MMNNQPSDALLRAIERSQPDEDRLETIRGMARRARDADLVVDDLARRLDEAKAERNKLLAEELPALMDGAHVSSIELAAEGNTPAVKVEIKPYCNANIAASWPEERRRAAFDWLDGNDYGDLIKTVVTIRLPREQRDKATRLLAGLKKQGFAAEVEEAVHSQTLSAWLRELFKTGATRPPLDLIGASVGRTAVIKRLKGD